MEHRLDVEELVGYLGDEQLTYDDDADDGPEALTHFQLEHALARFEAAGIEHIPEVCPDENREQESGFVGSHGIFGADGSMEHLRDRCNFGMIEEPVEAEGYGEEEYAYADKLRHHGAREDGGFAAAGLLVHDATRRRQ